MSKLVSFFTSLSLLFAYLFNFSPAVSDGYKVVDSQKITVLNALVGAQGICTDGEYYYTSGAIAAVNLTGLAKWTTDFKRVKRVLNPLPKEITEKYGSNHIGGIDVYNGTLYCAVEDHGYDYPLVLLFDADTLEYTGKCYELDREMLTDGCPWCAVDRDKGLLYTSTYNHAERILCYDLNNDLAYTGEIAMSQEVHRVQGGSVYNGRLYLSRETPDSTDEEVFSLDLATGEVRLEMVRSMSNYDNEAEDLCVYPMPDGTLFHTQDYDKLLGVNFTHYSVDN